MDRLGNSGNLNRLFDLEIWEKEKHRVKNVFHDLRSGVNPFVSKEIGIVDYVLHMAAGTHVDDSIRDPMSFVLDNVVATTNILLWARDGGIKRRIDERGDTKELQGVFVYFSTDEVFGPAPEGTEYPEWARYNSGNPYAAAKAGGEEMALAFANTYFMPVVITHTMNVFGERQHPQKFIPMTIKKLLNNEKIIVHANKEKTKAGSRFWIHARNVAACMLHILERYDHADPYNVLPHGTYWHGNPYADKFNIVGEKEVDALEMAQYISKVMGDMGIEHKFEAEMVDFHSSRPGHDLRYALDGKKMKEMGWSLPKTFEESLRKTIEWSIKNKDKWL